VKRDKHIPSLRSYLEPRGTGFYLRFTPTTEEGTTEKRRGFPFVVLDESDPACRIIDAEIVTDEGCSVRRVSVLAQHDTYPQAGFPIFPVTNRDMDLCWEKSLPYYAEKGSHGSAYLLASQKSDQGQMVPFESLFFCTSKQAYFPPVCSVCGAPLRQCYDDDLLTRSGLQPYSTTTKRYLFCPSCMDLTGTTDFFTYRLDSSDSEPVKDRWDLIHGFGKVDSDKGRQSGLPCVGCEHHDACYGQEGLVAKRITAVAFYPFFMVLVRAPSLNGSDFLALLSGANPEQLQKRLKGLGNIGRASRVLSFMQKHAGRPPLFFKDDPRRFLEILFLKMAFLADLVDEVWPRFKTYAYPDLGVSLDRVWVHVPEKGPLLPVFWDAKANLLDMAGHGIETPPSSTLKFANSLQHLGMVWFTGLVGNESQDWKVIWEALAGGLEKENDRANPSFAVACGTLLETVFSPENIFWTPQTLDDENVGQEVTAFWQEALDLGWSLLIADVGADPDVLYARLREGISHIQSQVQESLFSKDASFVREEASQPPLDRSRTAFDGKIGRILAAVANEWRVPTEKVKEEPETAIISPSKMTPQKEVTRPTDSSKTGTEDVEETVLISPTDADSGPLEVNVPPQVDDVQETVILSSGNFEESEARGREFDDDVPDTVKIIKSAGENSKASEDMPETVIMSAPASSLQQPSSRALDADTSGRDDALMETVIVSPVNQSDMPKPGPQQSKKVTTDRVGLEETIAGYPSPSEKAEMEDDAFLEETVIIRPPKKKGE